MSPTMILGVLLAVSVALNAWQYHDHDKTVAAVATAQQLNRDTVAVANECKASVDDLATKSGARQTKIDRALDQWAGLILSRQGEANAALSARPSNPNDLCGSATLWAREQISKERKP